MYCADRWEREYFDEHKIPRREPAWLICLVLLVGPLVAAVISVVFAMHVENIDPHTYLH
ncbi:MAG TPA: hypothetical protein VH678_08380 [Xanthobacteraceae bacterium]|jgi:hypothetical protein